MTSTQQRLLAVSALVAGGGGVILGFVPMTHSLGMFLLPLLGFWFLTGICILAGFGWLSFRVFSRKAVATTQEKRMHILLLLAIVAWLCGLLRIA